MLGVARLGRSIVCERGWLAGRAGFQVVLMVQAFVLSFSSRCGAQICLTNISV